jgi:hypothetical protein
MVDIKKELDKIIKELEELEDKQEKINYLQKLYEETEDPQLKSEILHILDELLERQTLEEVIEPTRLRHEIIEEIKREQPIINVLPPELTEPTPIVPEQREEEEKEEEQVEYQKPLSYKDLVEADYTVLTPPSLPKGQLEREGNLKYVLPEDVIEKQSKTYQTQEEPTKEYLSTVPLSEREAIGNRDIQQFSIETLLKREQKQFKKIKEEKGEW